MKTETWILMNCLMVLPAVVRTFTLFSNHDRMRAAISIESMGPDFLFFEKDFNESFYTLTCSCLGGNNHSWSII